ncbi:MAG TPA: choice-of-anchor D domain-containing protein, partial [Gemmatimonadales bacterium]|nr:choice-of-anchor D domain-containing protein [Gemmatimonadales bacterium]
QTSLPAQNVQVTGNVYRLATGNATPAPLDLGNFRLTAPTVTGNLAVQNTAANDGYSEQLGIQSVTPTTGLFTATNNLGATRVNAGVTASNAITVGLGSGLTAGVNSGAISIQYLSDGTVSGTGAPIDSNLQNVTVTATGYRLAAASAHTPEPVVLANQRVGGELTQGLSLTNTAANDGFSEKLNATIPPTSGDVGASGSFTGLAAGATNSSSLRVAVDTTTAGAKSGTATITLASDGTGTSGFTALGIGTQTVTVQGTVYRLAQGDTTPLTVNFSNRHVGDAATQTLTVQNLAATDGYSERLNASFGTPTGTGVTTNGGSITLLAAGGANSSALAVGLDTATAGAKSGTVAVNYQSDGSGTSGLTAIGAGSQTVTVSGAVYRLASAQIDNPGAFSFGNVHVGDTVQRALSITNTAANDGYSERLDASFGGTSDARITTSGSIGLLAAGATNASSMVIGVNTAAAGSVNGTATVAFASNGSGTSGLGVTGLPAQDVTVSATIEGGVYRLANPVIQTAQPVDFGNVRINTMVASQALSIKNDVPNDGFSEKLNASANGTTGGVTASGAFTLLAPQAVNSTDILVGLNTSVAGNRSGVATINFVSDGTGTSGLGQTSLPAQNVQVTGNVYRLANPVVNTPTVILAARVGDVSPTTGVSVTNNSPDIYTEGLNVTRGSTPAVFTSAGSVTNLAAGGSSGAVQVALNTGTAGTFAGQQGLNFISTGAGTTNAPDVSVGTGSVSLTGKVYTPAQASVAPTSINFGIVHVGDTVSAQNIAVTN